MYYVLIGGKDEALNKGVIVVLKGQSLENLSYHFTIGPLYELGDMGECPSYHMIENRIVLVASGCRVAMRDNDFKNENSSVFIVGDIDFETGNYKIDFIKEIDKGDAFYAPQIVNSYQEPIMIGWMETWGKPYLTHELGHNWSGALSIPRKLSIKNNDIYQEPISLEKYRKEFVPKTTNSFEMLCHVKNGDTIDVVGENGTVSIKLDSKIILDTTLSNNLNPTLRMTNNDYTECDVLILVDVSSIEVFVDNGKETISSRIFLDGNYIINVSENVEILYIYEIGVD